MLQALPFLKIFSVYPIRATTRRAYQGLIHLGCTDATLPAVEYATAFAASACASFEVHDYILGFARRLATMRFGTDMCIFTATVAGFDLRRAFPLVCEWVDRTNAEGCMNARRFGQKLYSVAEMVNLSAVRL